jgi:thiol-disulfide isomerase/thioredoxin
MRPRLAGMLMGAAMALALAGCSGSGGGGAPAPEPRNESEIPLLFRFDDFKPVPLVGGGEFSLAACEGQVVLLDLFNADLPDCRRYAPVLVSLYYRYRSQGLTIVGLDYERTLGPEQAAAAVEAYREEFATLYDLALGPDSLWAPLRHNAGARIDVPALVLLDRQGVVREVFENLPPGHEAILADRIERLLAEGAGPPPVIPEAGAAQSTPR